MQGPIRRLAAPSSCRCATHETFSHRYTTRMSRCHHNTPPASFQNLEAHGEQQRQSAYLESGHPGRSGFLQSPRTGAAAHLIEVHPTHCEYLASIYGESARAALIDVLLEVEETMHRLHSCKVIMALNMDDNHMRRRYHK
jgi:hypothetical protein